MHEISLCEGIRTLLQEQAVKQDFSRVTKVWLDVGALSCVEPEALRFGFGAVMRGSVAEGAELHIDVINGEADCPACGKTVPVSGRFDPCPQCGSPLLYPRGGNELKIRKMEVV